MSDSYLMHEDTPVFKTTDDLEFIVLNESLLPFLFKDYIREYKPTTDNIKYEAKQMQIVWEANNTLRTNWLSSRTLVLSQKYAKRLYQAYCLKQKDDSNSRAKLVCTYKALSLSDNYWVTDDLSVKWDNINIRHNSLKNAVKQIQLHGRSLMLDGSPDPAAFSARGAYAKSWHRDPDGSLWLYKAGDNQEERIEVMCSNILDRCNVSHCYYELRCDEELSVCACPAMSSDAISMADGEEIITYFNHHEQNPDRELQRLDPIGYFNMFIVDYLLANRDRHTQNWGIYYKANTMEILGLFPLFDHNNAFEVDVMQNENFKSHFLDKTLKENAMYAIKHVDFHFTAPITRDLFITKRQYETFMKRADQLGVKIRKPTIDDIFIQCGGFQKYKYETLSLIPSAIKECDDYNLQMSSMFCALQQVQGTHNCYRKS